MRFQGKLFAPYRSIVSSTPINTTLSFTKNQIVFPEGLRDGVFESREIVHGAKYELTISPNIDRSLVYQVIIDGKSFRLFVNRFNEVKLKWVHGKYLVQKEPLAVIAIIISLISIFTQL